MIPTSSPPAEAEAVMSFAEMLADVRSRFDTSKAMAERLEISPQYLHDLEHGRRLPSVEFVKRVCSYLGRGPVGRAEWNAAAARTHGWEI